MEFTVCQGGSVCADESDAAGVAKAGLPAMVSANSLPSDGANVE